MKNKKGFTLVELLAVIAILAILVIIALPNVLEMYRQARKNSFENEVKEIFRSAQQQYLLNSLDMNGGGVMFFASNGKNNDANNDGSTMAKAKKLDMQGGANIKYCVKISGQGTVLQLKVSNGTYLYDFTDETNGITDAAIINTEKNSVGGEATGNKITQPDPVVEVFSNEHTCS